MAVQMQDTQTQKNPWRLVLLLTIGMFIVIALPLFLSAGRINWGWGWIYVAMMVSLTAITRSVAALKHPEMLYERSQVLTKQDAKGWDKFIMPLIVLIGMLVIPVVAGLDYRFAWSPLLGFNAQFLALIITLIASAFSSWPMLVNPFFSATVRIQEDREHYVVGEGPYRYVRHPSYAGMLIAYPSASLMLGSLWTLIPSVILMVLLVIRTKLEDDTLQAELEGYKAYTEKTRYRLIPWVW